MIRAAALALLVGGCAAQAPAVRPGMPPPAAVPAPLTWCPEGAPVPRAPGRPRTVEQLGAWAIKLDKALHDTELARSVCAVRLRRLNDWIDGGELAANSFGKSQ